MVTRDDLTWLLDSLDALMALINQAEMNLYPFLPLI